MRLSGPQKIVSSHFGSSSSSATKIMGNSELARRIRAYDWASTPLGPINNWSSELVTVLNLVLSLPTPARLLWSPGLILLFNDKYAAILGRRHPDALGKPARQVFHDTWNAVGPVLETAFFTGEPFICDKRRVPIGAGDSVMDFYFDCTCSPIYENGRVAGLLNLFHDVTRDVITSRNQEARSNALYSTSLQYIGLVSPAGVLLDCNRAVLELNRTGSSDLIGRHLAETPLFARTPPVADVVRQGIAVGRSGRAFRSHLSLAGEGGELLTFDFCFTPVRDSAGAVVSIVAEGRDISEEKRVVSALLKSEKLAAVGRLASSIAHEINNPLESVMNLIYLARNSQGTDAERYLDLADQEIRRVSIIANQTLRFHKQAAKPQGATAADLFSTVMSIYEGRLRNAHIQVERRFRSGKPVTCFPGDVRQVLNNLVANALEAMPFGGRLLIRSREGRDWKTGRSGLVLTVADNGTGIPPAVKKKIFDAFFTTKGTAGNGLGLWVCHEIVERHRGNLRVRSCQRRGRNGTAFTLFLPFDTAFA